LPKSKLISKPQGHIRQTGLFEEGNDD